MDRPPSRCHNSDCEDSLGGMYQRSQFEQLDDGSWKCRECGRHHDD